MGGSPNLLMPVQPSYTASWLSHTHRSPKSREPGTDLFVPIGTPVHAPADGWIYGYGESIVPATGRWIGINFDNGMKGRGMHFSRLVRRSGYVRRGELIAYSGASGYGHEDWSRLPGMPGAHVHWTMWESHNPPQLFGYRPDGRPWTVDLMQYVGGEQVAGVENGGGVVVPEKNREDIMASIPPLAKQANSNNIWAINPNGTKRLVPPAEMEVYKSIAAKLKLDINTYIAEDTALSQIKNG